MTIQPYSDLVLFDFDGAVHKAAPVAASLLVTEPLRAERRSTFGGVSISRGNYEYGVLTVTLELQNTSLIWKFLDLVAPDGIWLRIGGTVQHMIGTIISRRNFSFRIPEMARIELSFYGAFDSQNTLPTINFDQTHAEKVGHAQLAITENSNAMQILDLSVGWSRSIELIGGSGLSFVPQTQWAGQGSVQAYEKYVPTTLEVDIAVASPFFGLSFSAKYDRSRQAFADTSQHELFITSLPLIT